MSNFLSETVTIRLIILKQTNASLVHWYDTVSDRYPTDGVASLFVHANEVFDEHL